jgi:hypothetical protein
MAPFWDSIGVFDVQNELQLLIADALKIQVKPWISPCSGWPVQGVETDRIISPTGMDLILYV